MKELFKVFDNNTFMNYKYNCFSEFLNNSCQKLLQKNKEYKKLNKKLEKIKKKYPKVRQLLDEYSVEENITSNDNDKIHEAMTLQEDIDILKRKIIFRLGEKEMINFFMDIKVDEDKENN